MNSKLPVIASLHLVEYEKRVFSPPRRFRTRVAGLRFWRPLNIGGDIGWFREHGGRREVYRRLLVPNFHRWAFYAVWDDDPNVETFLRTPAVDGRWPGALEACHFWLRPNSLRGPWHGAQVLRESGGAEPARGPIAYITRADLSPRGTLAFWRSAAPNLSYHLPDRDEMPFAIALSDRPYMQLLVFSVWRTQESAVKFAYREQGHRDAVESVRSVQPDLVERFSAASFEPYRCEGTWEGREVPLPEAQRATARSGREPQPRRPSEG